MEGCGVGGGGGVGWKVWEEEEEECGMEGCGMEGVGWRRRRSVGWWGVGWRVWCKVLPKTDSLKWYYLGDSELLQKHLPSHHILTHCRT